MVPRESPDVLSHSKELSSLPRITDLKLVAAILSGQLDSSILEQPSGKHLNSCTFRCREPSYFWLS